MFRKSIYKLLSKVEGELYRHPEYITKVQIILLPLFSEKPSNPLHFCVLSVIQYEIHCAKY